MAVPVTLIPLALSAVRSFLHLRQRVIDIRDTGRLDDPLPLLLPALPPSLVENPTQDPKRMLEAFRDNPVFRAALEARGLREQFDLFHDNIDPLTGEPLEQERHADMFWRFMGLYYQVRRQEGAADLPDIEVDQAGIDRFLVRSAAAGGKPEGVQVLRATAETLVDFLGENASIFLARSSNKVILSSVLREFATRTDLETDGPKRVLKMLVGSVAVAAADHGAEATDNPAAALLFGALGRARQEFGDDFVARIASHEGFTAVVSDWVGSLAEDPYLVDLLADLKGLDDGSYDPADPTTLPARLQPVFGALKNTVGVIGRHIGTAEPLSQEQAFRDVFSAVLSGVTQNAGALLGEKLDGDRFMADLLEAVISTVGQSGAVQSNDLIAPVFRDLMAQMAAVVPTVGQDAALSRAEVILQDLARRVTSGQTQAVLAELEGLGGERFARGLMIEVFTIARARTDVLLAGDSERAQAVAEVLFGHMPEVLRTGLDRDGAVRIFEEMLGQLYPQDTPDGAFVLGLLPHLTGLAGAIAERRPKLAPGAVEDMLRLLAERLAADRPVWQRLHEAGHMGVVIGAVASVLKGDGVPKTLTALTALEIADEALGVLSRHGLKLEDVAAAAADPEAFLKERVEALVGQAVDAAVERLGRDAGGDDLASIVRRVLAEALAADDPQALGAGELTKAVEAAIRDLV
ncbi:MAG: hypothetical protein AAGA87_00990 [Pseudomonadota bacterium]